MTDEATTSEALEALQAKAQQTFAEESDKYAENLAPLQAGGDAVTKQLLTEIVERLGMLSRQMDIPYTVFFPLHFHDAMLAAVWHGDAVRITEFIEGGGAKEALDDRYFELEGGEGNPEEE